MTLVLLIGAGLLARSFQRLLEVDPGFRIDNSVALEISRSRPRNREERLRLASFLDRTIQTLEQLPGIQQVGGVNSFPLGSNFSNGQFLVEKSYQEWAFALDQAPDWERFGQLAETSEKGYAEYRLASEGYFATMGIALLQGRLFESTDSPESAHVGVISQSLAETHWAGQREYLPARTLSPPITKSAALVKVVTCSEPALHIRSGGRLAARASKVLPFSEGRPYSMAISWPFSSTVTVSRGAIWPSAPHTANNNTPRKIRNFGFLISVLLWPGSQRPFNSPKPSS